MANLACMLLLCALITPRASAQESVLFDWFEYRGRDTVFDAPLPPGYYRNPVLAGFHPDPAVTRAGDRFYLVTSSFAFFPGIPVFHSADLVHWRQIGNVDRSRRAAGFRWAGLSRGVFAPAIEYHDGIFYMAQHLRRLRRQLHCHRRAIPRVRGPTRSGCPSSTASIPSLFFDDDGTPGSLNNDPPHGQAALRRPPRDLDAAIRPGDA